MSAAAIKLETGKPVSVPDHPPTPTAGMVLERRDAKERELELLTSRVGAMAYQAVIGGKVGAEALASLDRQIHAAQFSLDCVEAAHAHAIEVDREAVASWWTALHEMPADQVIAGISKTECCRRCSEAGCVITGQECANPIKTGPNLNLRHQGNPAIRRLHIAAAKKLGVYR